MAEPLVLLPGLMCDARVFWPQIVRLSRTHPLCIATLDGDTVEDMAQAALAVAPGRFAACGLGLGGVVALEMLRRAPERFSRIALVSTDPLAETPATAAAREHSRVLARAGKLAEAIALELPPGALAEGEHRRDVCALVAEMAQGLGAACFLRQSKALQRRPDQQKTLRRALLPTLVLCGAQDGIVPARRQEFAADLMPRARLVTLPHAGHLPPIEDPAGTMRALEDWLDRTDP
jgi:pimeloyl-ACP methyl ester carboxylesterase